MEKLSKREAAKMIVKNGRCKAFEPECVECPWYNGGENCEALFKDSTVKRAKKYLKDHPKKKKKPDSTKWQKLELDNLPSDIFKGGDGKPVYEFEYFNKYFGDSAKWNPELDTTWNWFVRWWLKDMKHLNYRYRLRKQEEKAKEEKVIFSNLQLESVTRGPGWVCKVTLGNGIFVQNHSLDNTTRYKLVQEN